MAFSIKRVLDLFYPRLCLHCDQLLPQEKNTLCPICLEQISLIDTHGRCRTCFAEFGKGRCERCSHRSVVIHKQLAACETFGPARTLLNAITSGRPESIPAAASLMAYQWLACKLPLPDLLIPLPSTFWQKQKMGFDPHHMLASEIGKVFSAPVHGVLRKVFDRSHFLSHGEFRHRIQVSQRCREALCDKKILLIAPLLDDALFRSIGHELKAFFPTQVDALAFGFIE